MPISNENIRAHEFIGRELTITKAYDPTLLGVNGIVRDETRNTLRVEAHGKILTVPKLGTIFNLKTETGEIFTVNGDQVSYRPEDRVKKGLTKQQW
jgi:ribonuclease P protein subunit POP4